MCRVGEIRDPLGTTATFIIVFRLLIFTRLKTTEAAPFNTSSSSVQDSQLTWDISTDNVAAYSIIPMLNLESLTENAPSKTATSTSREKRSAKAKHVFKAVSPSAMKTLPYYASVRISDRCSGTMISNNHVLTAAHCVHNGKSSIFKLSKLRVGKCLAPFIYRLRTKLCTLFTGRKSRACTGSKVIF